MLKEKAKDASLALLPNMYVCAQARACSFYGTQK